MHKNSKNKTDRSRHACFGNLLKNFCSIFSLPCTPSQDNINTENRREIKLMEEAKMRSRSPAASEHSRSPTPSVQSTLSQDIPPYIASPVSSITNQSSINSRLTSSEDDETSLENENNFININAQFSFFPSEEKSEEKSNGSNESSDFVEIDYPKDGTGFYSKYS